MDDYLKRKDPKQKALKKARQSVGGAFSSKKSCDSENLLTKDLGNVNNFPTRSISNASNIPTKTPETSAMNKYPSNKGGSPVNLQCGKTEAVSKSKIISRQTCKNQSTPSRHIPAAIKNEVLKRDNYSCSYVDPLTKRRCSSQHGIQIDHKKPFSWQGTHTISNLQVLCFQHNEWKGAKIL